MRNCIVYCFEEGGNFHRYFPCLHHIWVFVHEQCHHHILHRSYVNTELIIEKVHRFYLLFLSNFCVVSIGLSQSGYQHSWYLNAFLSLDRKGGCKRVKDMDSFGIRNDEGLQSIYLLNISFYKFPNLTIHDLLLLKICLYFINSSLDLFHFGVLHLHLAWW